MASRLNIHASVRQTSDGASVLGGFGFQGYDKDGKVVGWDGVRCYGLG